MNFLKDDQKSWTTRESDVNPNSFIQNAFLEGMFRDILQDHHQGLLENVQSKLPSIHSLQRAPQSLKENLFQVTAEINLEAIVKNMNNFFLSKSPSFSNGDLNQILELKYSNSSIRYPTYQAKELLLLNTKISADSEKIEKIPNKMKEMLICMEREDEFGCPLAQIIREYSQEYINFVVVYFGYYNFDLVKNTHFEDQQICLFGKRYLLRINAIFVSKVALMDTFRAICKVPNLEEIDELLIQLYQLKRQKNKARKKKQIDKNLSQSSKNLKKCQENRLPQKHKGIGVKTLIGLTAVGVVVTIGKLFS